MIHEPLALREYSLKLIEQSSGMDNIGLSGKLGVAIYLFEYSRIFSQKSFFNLAEQLVSDVIENISYDSSSISDHNGILNIGTGIAYLYDRGFIQGDADEVLAEIDELVRYMINFRTILNDHISNTLCGLLFYLYLRIKQRTNRTLASFRNREYLIYAIDWLEDLYTQGHMLDDKLYTLIGLLHNIKVYPTKTNLLLSMLLRDISSQSKFYSEIDLLEIAHLSMLRLWYIDNDMNKNY